jgi:site-specific DNA-methyltransferase (adenine-specific)
MYTLSHGDCRDALRGIADHSIDAVITDPPYEIAFESWDASGIAHDVRFWAQVLRVLKPGGMLLAFSGTRLYHRLAIAIEGAGFEIRDMLGWLYANGQPRGFDLGEETGGVWAGWNPTLKPCVDPICTARRPFAGRLTDNVISWGVGAYHIAACSIRGARAGNVILDDGAVSAYAKDYGLDLARFYYCAKAAPGERDAGCEHLGGNPLGCVKPLELMRYLCRLVTPPKGTILDPFMGSGSTGCAAVQEGFNFIGIDRDPQHVKVAEARIRYWGGLFL